MENLCWFWKWWRRNHVRRKGPSPCKEEGRKHAWWERRGDEAQDSSRTKSCKEEINPPPPHTHTLQVADTDSLLGYQKEIVEDLIKEKAVDGIRPLGNRINNYINQIFANSVHCGEKPCRLDLRLISKGPFTRVENNQILLHLLFQ